MKQLLCENGVGGWGLGAGGWGLGWADRRNIGVREGETVGEIDLVR